MSFHWLLITCSWFGTASLQYINTANPGADILDQLDSNLQYPLPYINYIAQPNSETFQNEPLDYFPEEVQRKRRTADITDARNWMPNLIDTDKTLYLRNDDIPVPFAYDDNNTEVDKRNFSPWGGKRGDVKASVEHMWTWKRAEAIREPSMPKRVRFSPWGGKRSGQMIYKPGSKGSKIIFSTSIPELTRIVSNYSPSGKRFDLAGFQFIPTMDKRHPLKVLTLSAQMDGRTLREAMPFKKYLETMPKNYKPGHPYTDVHLKKDGKRKVKFSAWGGKRSPPIIGPIWTPTTQDLKESTLNTIILIRNSPDLEDKSM